MKVKDLIKKLEKFDGEMVVLGEFDQDGDDFIVKVDIKKVYKGDGFGDDDNFTDDEDERFCIIKLGY
jgi:hypothetical protein